MVRILSGLFLAVFSLCAQQLSVRSATARRVELAWTGSSPAWTVERKTGSGQFETLATASSGSYLDEQIAPYATYHYRVRGRAAASNEVVVGPPPSGVNLPASLPAGADALKYGTNTALTFDENGDPAVAFLWADANGDNDYSDDTLYFVRWSRAGYAWKAPVKVAVTGEIQSHVEPASLACDRATGTFAMSYPRAGVQGIEVAISSDAGATWHTSRLAANLKGMVATTALAAANGRWQLALSSDQGGVEYFTGPVSAAPSEWKMQAAPAPDKGRFAPLVSIALAVDELGRPLVAYWVAPEEGDNYRVLLWSPENGRVAQAADSNRRRPDAPNLRMIVATGKTRLLINCARDKKDTDSSIWYTASASSGASWSNPVKLPIDALRSTNQPLALAADSRGRTAAVFASNSGSGDTACGYPVVSISNDGSRWTTCGLGKRTGGDFDPQPSSINAAYGPDDRLNVLWHQEGDNKYGRGVLLWRE